LPWPAAVAAACMGERWGRQVRRGIRAAT